MWSTFKKRRELPIPLSNALRCHYVCSEHLNECFPKNITTDVTPTSVNTSRDTLILITNNIITNNSSIWRKSLFPRRLQCQNGRLHYVDRGTLNQLFLENLTIYETPIAANMSRGSLILYTIKFIKINSIIWRIWPNIQTLFPENLRQQRKFPANFPDVFARQSVLNHRKHLYLVLFVNPWCCPLVVVEFQCIPPSNPKI